MSRDAYGFAVRPQNVQRYREYANIYKARLPFLISPIILVEFSGLDVVDWFRMS